MKAALDTALTWLGSFFAAIALSASGALDNLSGGIPDHATILFLLALVLCLACVLVWLYIRSWRRVEDALEYRTADYSAIDTQTRALQAKVPSARSRTHYLKPCTTPHAEPRSTQADPLPWREKFEPKFPNVVKIDGVARRNLAQVRVQAAAAALRDMGQGTYTRNRYAPGTPAHDAWAEAHASVYQVKLARSAPVTAETEA